MAGEQQEALLRSFMSADAQIRAKVIPLVLQVFDRLGSWRDADIARFTSTVVPVLVGAERQMGSLTQAFVAAVVADALGVPARPIADGVTTGAGLRGVDPAEVYARPIRTVWRELAAGADLATALTRAKLRLAQIAETDLQLAKTHAARTALAGDERVAGFRRVLTGSHSCGLCVLASTQRYHRGDLMPIHPGCVPAGSLVSAEGVLAITRRGYSGELAVVGTAAGDEVTVTPNHPVLTDKGWVPGHLVREGDYVVRRVRRHRVVGRGPDEGHGPVLVEDVWRAVSVSRLVRVPLTTQDFHGDGADGEVEIVWPHGYLAPVGDVSFGKPASERALVRGQLRRVLFPARGVSASLTPGGLAATVGRVGCSDLCESSFRSHLCSAHQASFRSTARWDAEIQENSTDGTAFNAVLVGDGQFRETSGVILSDLSSREVAPCPAPTRFDPPTVEFSGEGRRTYAELGSGLLNRLSGQIELDRVIEVRRVDYSGHVFNLHTDEGWYQSHNHIISNCDCGIAPIIGTEDPGHVIDQPLLDAAHAAIADRFGAFDASGRNPDYRDVIVTHEHGEIGPVLARRGDDFTGPSDLN